MGSWWRSEDMTFVSLILSEEVVFKVVEIIITNINNTDTINRLLLAVLEN